MHLQIIKRSTVRKTLHSVLVGLMMMAGPEISSNLALRVCLLGPIVFCLLWRSTPLFSRQYSLRFTALVVKFIDFHGDLYCFLIYISRLFVVIFETWLWSLPCFYEVLSIVSGSADCSYYYTLALSSSSESFSLKFLIRAKPYLGIQDMKKVSTFFIFE